MFLSANALRLSAGMLREAATSSTICPHIELAKAWVCSRLAGLISVDI